MTFDEMRADFIVRRKGSLALPMTGVLVYSAAALLSLIVPDSYRNRVLSLLLVDHACRPCHWPVREEEMGTPANNPLFRLSAMARIMALATSAIHVPVWIYARALFPSASASACLALGRVLLDDRPSA